MPPLKLSMDVDFVKLTSNAVKTITRDTKYALRTTVTQTAVQIRKDLKKELETKLDRPVPFITKAYFYKPATNLDKPEALVYVRGDKVDNYIESLIKTGAHVATRLTLRFTHHTRLLNPGESLVPTRRVKRNRYGNVPGSAVSRLISSNAAGTVATKRAIVRRTGKYRGIYQIQGRKYVKIWTPAIVKKYRPPINVDKVVTNVTKDFDKRFDKNIQINLQRSLKKAGLV